MKLFIIILTTLLLTSCCYKYDDKDFEFTENHNRLLNSYKENDTIYFQNKFGELDTIWVSKIDNFKECGCLLTENRKHIAIQIKHLPKNNWIGGTEGNLNKPSKELDQNLIVIEKTLKSKNENYFIGINYRDFMGELTDLGKYYSDMRFEKYGIKKYWIITNDAEYWDKQRQDSNNSNIITRVFWTEKFGLTAYELRNGLIYEIKKNVP